MCNNLDVNRVINRGDIYMVDLGDFNSSNLEENPAILRKTRPCIIISNINYNDHGKISVVPIKSNNSDKYTDDEYLNMSYDCLVKIEMYEGTKFAVINKICPVDPSRVKRYIGSITNPAVMHKIDVAILQYMFGNFEEMTINAYDKDKCITIYDKSKIPHDETFNIPKLENARNMENTSDNVIDCLEYIDFDSCTSGFLCKDKCEISDNKSKIPHDETFNIPKLESAQNVGNSLNNVTANLNNIEVDLIEGIFSCKDKCKTPNDKSKIPHDETFDYEEIDKSIQHKVRKYKPSNIDKLYNSFTDEEKYRLYLFSRDCSNNALYVKYSLYSAKKDAIIPLLEKEYSK